MEPLGVRYVAGDWKPTRTAMNTLPASVHVLRGRGGFLVFALSALAGILLLSSCAAPSAKIQTVPTAEASKPDEIKGGPGYRTRITFHPDGRKVIEFEPINFFEAAIGGLTRGTLGFLASRPKSEE